MRFRRLRQLIRLYLEAKQDKKDNLLIEPEEIEGEEKEEFSAGGVAGAAVVRPRRKSTKK